VPSAPGAGATSVAYCNVQSTIFTSPSLPISRPRMVTD
jgi:hypothetical protein